MTGLLARITVTYLFLLLVVRVTGKQPLSRETAFDWLVAVVLGDFADDIVFGTVPLAQGAVAVGTLTLLHVGVGWLALHNRAFERLVSAAPRIVVRDGRIQRQAVLREHLSTGEFDGMLRLEAVADVQEVAAGRLELNGHASMLRAAAAKPAERRDRGKLHELLD